MQLKNFWPAALLFIFSCQNASTITTETYKWPEGVAAPVAEKKAKELLAHGDTRIDNYYWMNDYFKKGPDSAKVVEYLKAENAYLDTMLSGSKKLREDLFAEMKARIKEKDESVPYKDNGYWYYTRFEEGKQYPIYCRKKENLDAAEEIIHDANKAAEGKNYYNASGLTVSGNNELLAIGEDDVSRRLYKLRFKNLQTGEFFPETILNTQGSSYAWAADNKTVFYIKKDITTLLGYQVWRHELGADPSKDALIYEEKDNRHYINVGKTKSKKYILINSELSEQQSEARFLDASTPTGTFTVFYPRTMGLVYDVAHYNDKFYVRTNLDAPNFRLMECPLDKTSKENWKEVIAHRPDVLLESFSIFKDHLVLSERKEGLLNLRIINQKDKSDHYIQFDEPAYTANININPDFNTNLLRFSYQSMITPASVYDYNMDTKARELKKQQEILGGYNKEEYTTERSFAIARDGKKIPVSIVYKKGIQKNSNNPLLLYAYGSYGNSMDAYFDRDILSLLNRGFVYAIAHVRGGQEMGRQWYEDGKMLNKKNTFTDFIDCGEFLIKEKYTSEDHLYAMGGSAGGLLMGAITNMAPGMWHGVIAEVPFVDVITTMSDPDIPLTTNEYLEWGNPANKEEYFYMKSYSPIDNVEKKSYPNLLVLTGLHDSQVQYFEPAKWVAKLRELKTDKNKLLFHTNMDAGHGGASGRFDYLKEVALQYAFLLALEGISK
ncbi:MAG TPA: S9 family peptidase [Chitinophagaceae bacterium]|nr:S9 family peptidase [Chitinophagaceae bacterium]